jgi:hypothetical protein
MSLAFYATPAVRAACGGGTERMAIARDGLTMQVRMAEASIEWQRCGQTDASGTSLVSRRPPAG